MSYGVGLDNAGRSGAAVLALVFALGLAACEERAYPTPAEHAPPPPPAADLMAPPPASAPPPADDIPPPPPPPPSAAYAPGSPPGGVVAMAPIPNPGDAGSEGYYTGTRYEGRHRVHGRFYAGGSAPGYAAPRSRYHAPLMASSAAAPAPVEAHAAPAVHPVTTAKAPVKKVFAPAATVAAAGGVVAAHKAATAAKSTASAATTSTKTTTRTTTAVATTGKTTSPAAPTGDRAERLTKLQTALTDAVAKDAVLTAPDHFTANEPADVSLSLPAAFFKTVADEAEAQGLSDAAASVNLTAALAGDGLSVTPDERQAQPLTLGQPTQFHWTVVAEPGAKGPVHADVGADLLGGGSDTLALGAVQKAAPAGGKLKPRVIGLSLLVLIGVLVVGWLSRGLGSTRSSTTQASRTAKSGRPLDMTSGEP